MKLARFTPIIILLIFSIYYPPYSSCKTTENADKIIVLKLKREMHLLKAGEIIRSYKISLGANPKGHKQQEGDERTPEGVYKIDYRNSKSSYYKSLHISYPNAEDKKRAKDRGVSPGGDIVIHGIRNYFGWLGRLHRLWDWTDGCIAVSNKEMDEIWEIVPVGTIIEIKA